MYTLIRTLRNAISICVLTIAVITIGFTPAQVAASGSPVAAVAPASRVYKPPVNIRIGPSNRARLIVTAYSGTMRIIRGSRDCEWVLVSYDVRDRNGKAHSGRGWVSRTIFGLSKADVRDNYSR